MGTNPQRKSPTLDTKMSSSGKLQVLLVQLRDLASARIDPSPPTVQRCLADCLGGGVLELLGERGATLFLEVARGAA